MVGSGAEQKRAQLADRLREKAYLDKAFPLTPAQKRLWFLDQFRSASSAYSISFGVCAHGRLNVEALQAALDEIISRHRVLRTSFILKDGDPVQVIHSPIPCPLEMIKLENNVDDSSLQKIAADFSSRPFDLTSAPLIRALLIESSPEEWFLVLTMHHIVSDGWSLGVLFRELSMIYRAELRTETLNLAPLPLQYVDYAIWQQKKAGNIELIKCEEYWKNKLSGIESHLDLATDTPRPKQISFRGDRVSIHLNEDEMRQVQEFARKAGYTPFAILLAVFQALLFRYTGTSPILVGTPSANRNRPELEGLIGLFVNLLVIRGDCDFGQTFSELLSSISENVTEALQNQDLPFERLVEILQPERDPGRTPLFQVAFALQNTPFETVTVEGITLEHWPIAERTSKFDLMLELIQFEDHISGWIEYSTDLFARETIERLSSQYRIMLTSAMENPERPIGELTLLTREDEENILVRFNNTKRPYPAELGIHQRFSEMASRFSDHSALFWHGNAIRYGELEEHANSFSKVLNEQHIGRGDLIGICLSRSPEMIVSILAILKAGCAYVPLDPEDPPGRINHLMDRAGVRLVITSEMFRDRFSKDDPRVLLFELSDQLETGCKPTIEMENSGGDAPAYLMFTSGSTGEPKGVLVPHRAVMRLVVNNYYADLNERTVLLHMAPPSFDASTFELWGALLNGGTCVLYDGKTIASEEMRSLVANHRITTAWVTATLFNTLIDMDPSVFQGIKQLLTGGEALSVSHIRKAQKALPETELINGYGPTENTTFTCCYSIPNPLPGTMISIPIGRPIANTRVYLLDENDQPVAPGQSGRLFAGGDGLAIGYHGEIEKSGENRKFIHLKIAGLPEQRLYETGDLARLRNDGSLEFLGRSDAQVKIRGFRVEPGEIEAVMRQHPSVQQAVVKIFERGGVGKTVVGYFSTGDEPGRTALALGTYLKSQLPKYMVPGKLVYTSNFSLTPNGKIDLDSLPEPEWQKRIAGVDKRSGSALEIQVCQAMAEVLNLETVHAEDDFFELGGHSLLAVRLMAKIQDLTGCTLPLAVLFEAPTPAELALLFDQEEREADWSSLVLIQKGEGKDPMFLMHPAGGNVLRYRDLARLTDPGRPFYGLQARGLDGRSEPFDSVEEMASHYLAEIQKVQPDGPYLLGGFSAGGIIAWEIARQLHKNGKAPALLALFDTWGPGYAISPNQLIPFAPMLVEWLYNGWMQVENLAQMLPKQRIPYLVRKFKEGEWRRKKELPQALQKVRKVTTAAVHSYHVEPCDLKVTLFRAHNQPLFSKRDATSGWGNVARHGVEVHIVPGSHGHHIEQPFVPVLARKLRRCIMKSLRYESDPSG